MNVEDIEETIQNCLIQGLDIQITKNNIEEALDQLIPCLAFVGELEARCEYEYLLKKQEGIDVCDKRGERLILAYTESYAATEKSMYTRAKRLPKSLDNAISALQSRLKETTNI